MGELQLEKNQYFFCANEKFKTEQLLIRNV